jgi:hypothetical protein
MLLKHSHISITASILLLIPISVNAQEEQTIIQPQIPLNNSNVNPSINYPLGDLTQQGIINNNGTLGQPNSCGRSCINFYTDFSRNDSRFGVKE